MSSVGISSGEWERTMASEVKLPKREEKATTSAWLAGLAMRKKARSS